MNEFSIFEVSKAFLLAFFVAGLAWRLGYLSISGFFAAGILGGIVYGIAGLDWAFLLIAFFLSSSILSKIFSGKKKNVAKQFSKGGSRDWMQVAANGGVGALLILFASLGWISVEQAWIGFAASLAAVNADTWGTELGVLSRSRPRLVTNWKRVDPGTSGGISLMGSASALAGGLLIALLANLFQDQDLSYSLIILITLAGFAGAMIDSILGATLQAIYYCPKHEKETEQHPKHYCGTPSTYLRGLKWMSNDWVNFLSAAGAAVLAMIAALTLALVG
jgi:uncharacterized protein (TIGR00297 family)